MGACARSQASCFLQQIFAVAVESIALEATELDLSISSNGWSGRDAVRSVSLTPPVSHASVLPLLMRAVAAGLDSLAVKLLASPPGKPCPPLNGSAARLWVHVGDVELNFPRAPRAGRLKAM